MKKKLIGLLLCVCVLLTGCTAKPAQETAQPEQSTAAQPSAAAPAAEEASAPQIEQDAAWFAQETACGEWPEFTVNGTSIYDLTLDQLTRMYGGYERIYHWMNIQTSYYDIVQFADGSQAAGWMGTDGAIRHPNAAYLRLDAGVEVCGVPFGANYCEAANRFPRGDMPVTEQIDEHTTRLMLGGEIMYMGKYSYIEYTDGVPATLVVCDETVMTFYIEDGVIAAAGWMAPEEAMRLPITEQEAQQRMTIDPDLLTDAHLQSILLDPEITLVNNGFTFDSPADLSSEQLLMLFLLWSADSTRDNYLQADGRYHFSQDFISGILSQHFRPGSFRFDITQCADYDAADGTAIIENVSGFGGWRDLRIADVQILEGSTVQVTADFYNSDPFFDGSGGEIRYARKVYTLEFYNTGVLFQSARFAPLTEDDLRTALQLHTGETTDELPALFWTYDSQNGNILGDLPNGDFTTQPLTDETWDDLSLFVYARWARKNGWPLTISAVDFRNTLARYFPLSRYGWEDRSSLYLTYQDGTYTRTVNDHHGTRYCYLKRVSTMADGRFLLVFDYLDVREPVQYADADERVRAVFDHAGVTADLQPAQFRAAVYGAFRDGAIPLESDMTEFSVQVRLTGDALQPFLFVQSQKANA